MIYKMNTSLFYEVLLYLNSFYFGVFTLCEIAMFIIKKINFDFPNDSTLFEISILLSLVVLETVRILFGRKGNLTEKTIPVVISLLLTVPSAVGVVYLLLWQTYVLKLEWMLCCIQLSLHASEIVFAIFALISFYKNPYF